MVLVNEYRRIDRHSKSGVIGSNLLKLSEIQIWIVGPPHRPAFLPLNPRWAEPLPIPDKLGDEEQRRNIAHQQSSPARRAGLFH
jgi:hypothetical protein